jgi:hypothetical protein
MDCAMVQCELQRYVRQLRVCCTGHIRPLCWLRATPLFLRGVVLGCYSWCASAGRVLGLMLLCCWCGISFWCSCYTAFVLL